MAQAGARFGARRPCRWGDPVPGRSRDRLPSPNLIVVAGETGRRQPRYGQRITARRRSRSSLTCCSTAVARYIRTPSGSLEIGNGPRAPAVQDRAMREDRDRRDPLVVLEPPARRSDVHRAACADRRGRVEDRDPKLGRSAMLRECRASGSETQTKPRYSSGAKYTGVAQGRPTPSAVARTMYKLRSTIDRPSDCSCSASSSCLIRAPFVDTFELARSRGSSASGH